MQFSNTRLDKHCRSSSGERRHMPQQQECRFQSPLRRMFRLLYRLTLEELSQCCVWTFCTPLLHCGLLGVLGSSVQGFAEHSRAFVIDKDPSNMAWMGGSSMRARLSVIPWGGQMTYLGPGDFVKKAYPLRNNCRLPRPDDGDRRQAAGHADAFRIT